MEWRGGGSTFNGPKKATEGRVGEMVGREGKPGKRGLESREVISNGGRGEARVVKELGIGQKNRKWRIEKRNLVGS